MHASDLLTSPLQSRPGAPPRQRQLIQRLKQAILAGRLPAGDRLPASRALSEDLGVSRNTVLIAYEQLAAEGYVVADRQGTRVAAVSTHSTAAAEAAAPPPCAPRTARRLRSEEHTSELQSPCNLVCRLLLEKKKNHILRHETHQYTGTYAKIITSSHRSDTPPQPLLEGYAHHSPPSMAPSAD